jgi:5-(carboxyamino)imidazole ribonucleotide synthase
MGYRVHTYSPARDTPTGQVADVEVRAPYSDLDSIRAFARRVDVLTFEFENVPAAAAEAAAALVPVRPGAAALHVAQDRAREKQFLARLGLPVTPFAVVRSRAELAEAIARLGCPAVLKRAALGYDGKGQVVIYAPAAAGAAWDAIGGDGAVLEAFVDFACELSVVAARALDGTFAAWNVFANTHRNHVLDVSVAPAPIAETLAAQAVAMARAVCDELALVGVACLELFLTRDGRLLVNELAPRPHNSGHLTIEACVTSQFEQQVRAVCGLPLGATTQLSPAAMANLLGDLWRSPAPDWTAACREPTVKLHLYGKTEPVPGRKMGHLTALAAEVETAERTVRAARAALTSPGLPVERAGYR